MVIRFSVVFASTPGPPSLFFPKRCVVRLLCPDPHFKVLLLVVPIRHSHFPAASRKIIANPRFIWIIGGFQSVPSPHFRLVPILFPPLFLSFSPRNMILEVKGVDVFFNWKCFCWWCKTKWFNYCATRSCRLHSRALVSLIMSTRRCSPHTN